MDLIFITLKIIGRGLKPISQISKWIKTNL